MSILKYILDLLYSNKCLKKEISYERKYHLSSGLRIKLHWGRVKLSLWLFALLFNNCWSHGKNMPFHGFTFHRKDLSRTEPEVTLVLYVRVSTKINTLIATIRVVTFKRILFFTLLFFAWFMRYRLVYK